MVQSEMKAEGKEISIKKLCLWFGVARSTVYYKPKRSHPRALRPLDVILTEEVRKVIESNPTFGVRLITAMVRKALRRAINRKAVHRIMKINSWQVRKRPSGFKQRAKSMKSQTAQPNERWAEVVSEMLTIRSDNGLVFGSKAFVAVVNKYKIDQEYITPYTPEQNGMIERFFRTLKEECVWQHRFKSRDEAFEVIAEWMDGYHNDRPHSSLGYQAPEEFRRGLRAA